MLVAIPSKGRAGQTPSATLIASATLFVPDIEVADYRACGARQVVGVPGEVRGITKTRNWILDQADDRRVVFVDDDVRAQGWVELGDSRAVHRKLDESDWLAEWAKLFDVTEQLRLRAWGVATQGATRSVYPWKPLLFHTYVTASCMGLVNDGRTRFDESFPVKEDYELCLRLLKEDGAIVGARYLYWENEHWSTDGGCREYRTQRMEDDAIRRLIRMYPGLIRRVTRGGAGYSIELDF